MNLESPTVETLHMRPSRIWYQSFCRSAGAATVHAALAGRLTAYAGPGVRFEVHGMSPPDRYLGSLTEFRCAAQTIRIHCRHSNRASMDSLSGISRNLVCSSVGPPLTFPSST